MILHAIAKYINDNSNFFTQNKAAFYTPNVLSVEGNVLIMNCREQNGHYYKIEIVLGINSKIFTSCTCSKNNPEICEHQVASLNKTASLIRERKLSNDFLDYLPNARDTIIPTNKGIINTEEMRQINFSQKAYYYLPFEITKLSKHEVKFGFYDMGKNLEVSLIYAPEEDQLVAKCDCKSVNPCYHKSLVLEKFIQVYSPNYFSPKYRQLLKNKILTEKKLPQNLEFDDIYELIIDIQGIRYTEKISNVISPNISPLDALDLEELDQMNLPKNTEKYGVGLCIEFSKKQLISIFPFTAKLNKDGSELHSKFTEVDHHNIFDHKQLITNPNDFDFLMAALAFQYDFRYAKWEQWDKQKFEKAIGDFFPFVKQYANSYQTVLHDQRDSFVKKNVKPITLTMGTPKLIARINESEKFFNIQLKLRLNDQLLSIQSTKFIITPFGILSGTDFMVYPDVATAMLYARAVDYQEMNIIKTPDLDLRKQFIDPLSKFFEIEMTGLKTVKKAKEKLDFEKHIYLSDENSEFIVMRPVVKYGEQLLTPGSEEKLWTSENGFEFEERQTEQEVEFLNFVRNLHPEFEGMGSYFYLYASRALENLWLMDAIDQLTKQGVKVFGLNTLKKIPYNLNKPTFSMMLSSNTDWFDMKLDVKFGEQKADLRDIQKALLKRQNYVELKDGTLGLLPNEWIEKYKKYFKLGQVKKDQLEISNYQFSLIDELFEEMTNVPNFLQELYEKKKRLANLKEMQDVPKPKGLKADLRPYQQEGLNWMVFLEENQLGGCLADDMGLGKTLQTIAFLQHLKNKQPKTQLTNLVVAPTSLMFNWKAELKKFAPKLSVLVYTGANREELKDQIMKHDVVLTTYGSLINDITLHQNNEYNYAILDESQAIKNPESQRYKSVRLLRAKNRLVLTGTPIENNTFDLYSQFNFLNPGFFGSVKHFRATFSDAIDKEQDQESSLLLAKMINPFLLRRTKAQVATELPPKTEGFVYCEMGTAQRKVYEYYKQYYREQIQKQIEDEGINKSQMYILQGLTKLRQICNSTELADAERDFGAYSTKLDELVRHLKEKVSKHKVLIFSQFVGMLQIIQRRLEEENITFEYLDGQTRKREEKVNNFQSDNSIRVFLISLKAGGTGLNLTEADYVYLVDPWWNPAVENQAIDRCYRIGQNKNVMAYRMICTDTIEEKIVQLQERKLTVASEVIRTDMDKKSFNMKEVEHLFA